MSRTLRLSVIAVMLLSTTALSIMAYNTLFPSPPPEAAPAPIPPMARPRVSRLPVVIQKVLPAPQPPSPTPAQVAECVAAETAHYYRQVRFTLLAERMPRDTAGSTTFVPVQNGGGAVSFENKDLGPLVDEAARLRVAAMAAMGRAIENKCNDPSTYGSPSDDPKTVPGDKPPSDRTSPQPIKSVPDNKIKEVRHTHVLGKSTRSYDASGMGSDLEPETAPRPKSDGRTRKAEK